MGGPGTGKTVFALQALVNAAWERKQPGIFVAFEEGPDEICANAAPFGWGLGTKASNALFFLDARLSPAVVQSGDFDLSGMLAILEAKKRELGASLIVFDGIDVLVALLQNPGAEMREIYRLRGRTDVNNPEEHLIRIAALLLEHRPRCMVIDPLSAIARTGALSSARAIGNRLVHKVRDHRVTAVITSLVGGDDPQVEATELQISTIADTWIHLSYLVRGDERNRALTIVKSRGTRHSNQVRELLLSASGPALADVYSSGGRGADGHVALGKESRGESPEAAASGRIHS